VANSATQSFYRQKSLPVKGNVPRPPEIFDEVEEFV